MLVTLAALRADGVFDIPRLDHISIDGSAADWGERGFRVGVMGDENGKLQQPADFDASFRLGWDERGLLVLLNVNDSAHEEADDANLAIKNSVEMFYAPRRASRDVVKVEISPGVDPKHPELRMNIHDFRESQAMKLTKATVTAARTKTPGGYTLEALLPWKNLGIKPELGRELAFQIRVNDTARGEPVKALWYPRTEWAGHDATKSQRVRLSDDASAPVHAAVSGEYELFRRAIVHAAGSADLVGKTFSVKEGGRELGSTPMTADGDRTWARLVLPMPALGKAYGPLDVSLDGRPLQTYSLPDPNVERAKAFMQQKLNFQPNLFSGAKFPKCEFEQPSYVEDLIRPYTITPKFYDADYQAVTTAEKPGRYGAAVEIKTSEGKTYRRLLTLFRTKEHLDWSAHEALAGTIEFPKKGERGEKGGRRKGSTPDY